jgi:hypothetical protein
MTLRRGPTLREAILLWLFAALLLLTIGGVWELLADPPLILAPRLR